MSTSGPGATNLVTGLATSYMDSIPVVAITSNVPDSLIGKDSFQEISITNVTMPITKHNFFVNRIEDLEHCLREAFRIANSVEERSCTCRYYQGCNGCEDQVREHQLMNHILSRNACSDGQ